MCIYGSSIDEPLALLKGNNVYYYSKDGLGSVVNLTDITGNIAESYTYDEYGNLTSAPSQIPNRYLYTGREYDPEINLYYYRARYYDPTIGRFLQTDPIGYQGGINLYTYVKNNPLRWVDPLGLTPKADTFDKYYDKYVREAKLAAAVAIMETGGALVAGGIVMIQAGAPWIGVPTVILGGVIIGVGIEFLPGVDIFLPPWI